MTDDQGYGDLGINGNKIIKTPNIDDFSSRSVNFSNYHVGTTCSPTRAGLMTARNCLRNGVWHTNAGCSLLNQEEETIADVLFRALHCIVSLEAGYDIICVNTDTLTQISTTIHFTSPECQSTVTTFKGSVD